MASSSNETRAKLIVEAVGAEAVGNLTKQIDLTDGSLKALMADFKDGRVTLDDFTQNAESLNKRSESLRGTLSAVQNVLTAETRAAQEAAQAALELADAQEKAAQAAIDQAAAEAKQAQAMRDAAEAARAEARALEEKRAATKAAKDAADEARSKTNGLNQAVRGLGAGLSDVLANNGPLGQKIMGASNNVAQAVQGIAQAFGMLGPKAIVIAQGLELAFTAVGSTLQTLGIKNVDQLVNYFKGGVDTVIDKLSGLKSAIKSLEDKPVKLAVDVADLDRMNAELKKIETALRVIEEFKGLRSKVLRESGAKLKEVVGESEGGGAALRDTLKGQFINSDLQEKNTQALAEARKEQQDAQAEVDRLSEMKGLTSPEAVSMNLKMIENQQAKLEAARERAKSITAEITREGGRADQEAGTLLDRATNNTDQADQTKAQEEVARRVQAKNPVLAKQIREQAMPAAIKKKHEADDKEKADRLREEYRDLVEKSDYEDGDTTRMIAAVEKLDAKQMEKKVHIARESLRQIKEEQSVNEALLDLKAQLVIAESPQAEIDRQMTLFQNQRVESIRHQIGVLKEEYARKVAIRTLTEKLQEAGRTGDQIKAEVEANAAAPPKLINAKAAAHDADTDKAKALEENQEAGGTAKPGDTLLQIKENTRKSKKDVVAGKKDEAALKKEEEAKEKVKAEQDKSDKQIEKGLGDDFLAQAEARRLEMESDPATTNRERLKFKADLQRLAKARLMKNDPKLDQGEATAMAGRVPDFLNRDIQRQMDMIRAVPGNEQAGTNEVGQALYAGLLTQLQQRAMQQQQRAMQQQNRPRKREGMRSVPASEPAQQAPQQQSDPAVGQMGQASVRANVAALQAASGMNAQVRGLAQQLAFLEQQWQRLQRETQQQQRGFLRRGGR